MAMNDPSASVQKLDRSEGDLNLSPRRRAWAAENISVETQRLLDEDARYFLHQSLSTPCLNALKSCRDAWIEDVEGRRYLDFHGNIGDVRGLGLLMGLELLRKRKALERATDEAEEVMYGALCCGLNFKVSRGNILTLTPALTISRAELDQAFAILDHCIGEVEAARKS